jgi:serine/threonine protein phosphatase PrpC
VSSSHRPDAASAAAASTAARILLTSVAGGVDHVAATVQAVQSANQAAADQARDDDYGDTPACTYVSAVVTDKVTIGWLGDSRAYWLDERGGSVALTDDDAEFGSHAISAWLGADSGEPAPHTTVFEPDGPGVVLLCSDGLWNYVDDPAELTALAFPDAPEAPFRAADRLVQKALDSGGHDNVTVVLIPFPVPEDRS